MALVAMIAYYLFSVLVKIINLNNRIILLNNNFKFKGCTAIQIKREFSDY